MSSNSANGDRPSSLVVGLSIPQSQVNAATLLKAAREDEYDFVTTALPHTLEGREDVLTLDSKWWRTSIVGVCPEIPSHWDLTLERLPKQVQWGLHMNVPAIVLPAPPSPPALFLEYARLLQSLCLEASTSGTQLWVKVVLSDLALHQFDVLCRLCDTPACLGMILWAEPLAFGQTSASSASAASSNATAAGATVAAQMTVLHKAIGAQLKALCFPTKVFLTNKRGYPTLAKINQVLFTEALRRVGRTLRVVVEGPSVHEIPDGAGAGGTYCLPYLQYIHHIRQRPECLAALDSDVAQAEAAYLDSLQRPLQPLADHLENQMYETFERDPIKYVQYREACLRAMDAILLARQQSADANNMTDGTEHHNHHNHHPIVVVVAGAGRGPLVTAALEALEAILQRVVQQGDATTSSLPRIVVHAIEKNPSAVVYLHAMVAGDPLWKKHTIHVLHQDIRLVTQQQLTQPNTVLLTNKADIVISELLGSFGCNELSPECLQVLLSSDVCKSTTLSIPMKYTSYLAPVSSLRLFSEARHQSQLPAVISMGGGGSNGSSCTTSTISGQSVGPLAAMETPYVVRSHSAAQTHNELDCWSFSHDGMTAGGDLTRTVHLEFVTSPTHAAYCGGGSVPLDRAVEQLITANAGAAPTPITIHGFLGTFSADLFDEDHPSVKNLMGTPDSEMSSSAPPTQISTAPANFSKDMCSWFPLYFPLREPLPVPAGATVAASIWRRTDSATGYVQPTPVVTGASTAAAAAPQQHRVWYEWCAQIHRGGEILNVTPIHNPNGRSYHVSM